MQYNQKKLWQSQRYHLGFCKLRELVFMAPRIDWYLARKIHFLKIVRGQLKLENVRIDSDYSYKAVLFM